MKLSRRMSRLGTETAFEVLAEAKKLEKQGKDIVHLQIGEPDFKTPTHIVESAVQALRDGHHHYTPSAGIWELREAIAQYISSTRKISVTPEEVVVTPGGKPIIFFTMLALAQKGDEIVYPNPGFPIYASMIEYVGAHAVPIPLREENNFRLDLDELVKVLSPRTRMIILNSPNNPTGSILEKDDLQALSEILAGRDIMVFSDEIYSQILYDGQTHHSISSFPGMKERTIILEGFSKTYAMTGWRLGYGVMNPRLAEQITKLMINSNSCTAAFTQLAGISAIKGPLTDTKKMVATLKKRRDRMLTLLNQIEGVSCVKPEGAFYLFPNVSGLRWKSYELSQLLLNKSGVALLSGTAFGIYGEGHLRISYATSMKKLEEGMKRFIDLVEG